MAATALAEEVYGVIALAVDRGFYRAAYPELRTLGFDPLKHYAEEGWREGRDPAPWFNVTAYLQANDDVRESGVEPLHHYLTRGWREGRDAAPSQHGAAYLMTAARRGDVPGWRFDPPDPNGPTPEEIAADAAAREAAAQAAADQLQAERDVIAAEFDAGFYLETNPDVEAADPLRHFLTTGWRENRDPNPRFSLKEYLETYPDIAQAGINPFVHFIRAGRAEGRLARNELGFRYEMIAALLPVEERVARAVRASNRVKASDPALLAAAFAQSRTGLRNLHLTFSHDDYTTNTGGVQLCLQREGALIADLGRDHLHLYSAKPWPVVRAASDVSLLGVVLNGRRVGNFAPQAIVDALGAAVAAVQPGTRSLALHSLLGHEPDQTADIVQAAGITGGFFWLHDFASLCAGYHLLRNDVEDCAAPPPDSPACGICVYGPWRARHLEAHERLFRRLELVVVSPSQPTLDLWRRSWSFPTRGEIVHPHAKLVERAPAPDVALERPFRLAYAGMPTSHKGWPIFLDLVKKHAKDPRYAFLHLGGIAAGPSALEFHKVVVTGARPHAMQDALEKLEVDAVLMWPLCRETFSFAAYEAVAAGATIITGPDSGNVAAFVEASGHGWVLPDEDALAAALESGEIGALARARRKPMLYDLAFSGMTADLLAPEGRA